MSGLFITIEGGEGVGKTTQMNLLAERLRETGATVVATREPGGTPVGDRLRDLVLDPTLRMSAGTELLVYEASRAEHVVEVIEPALARGEVVICDRFFDSTTAYQSYGRGIDIGTVRSLNLAATGGRVPDITVLLLLDVESAMQRATKGGADRLESAGLEFHRRVRDGFVAIAAAEPERFVVIDAAGSPGEIGAAVWSAVRAHAAFRRAMQDRRS